jgi:hypothetical protein
VPARGCALGECFISFRFEDRMRFVLVLVLLVVACHSTTNPNAFSTFQACFDEHTQMEGFTPPCAIEICCIDHQIGSTAMNIVCGDTATSCQTYVGSNLTVPTDPNLGSDTMTACSHYVFDSGRSSTGSGGMCGS